MNWIGKIVIGGALSLLNGFLAAFIAGIVLELAGISGEYLAIGILVVCFLSCLVVAIRSYSTLIAVGKLVFITGFIVLGLPAVGAMATIFITVHEASDSTSVFGSIVGGGLVTTALSLIGLAVAAGCFVVGARILRRNPVPESES